VISASVVEATESPAPVVARNVLLRDNLLPQKVPCMENRRADWLFERLKKPISRINRMRAQKPNSRDRTTSPMVHSQENNISSAVELAEDEAAFGFDRHARLHIEN
jgi:hypothetical protein